MFPCKMKILPQFIFNSRDPIVMGVVVEAGQVKQGTPMCVPSKNVSNRLFQWMLDLPGGSWEDASGMLVCLSPGYRVLVGDEIQAFRSSLSCCSLLEELGPVVGYSLWAASGPCQKCGWRVFASHPPSSSPLLRFLYCNIK